MTERKLKEQIILGRNPVLEALESGHCFERIFLKSSIKGPFAEKIGRLCGSLQIPLKRVPPIKLDKLCNRNNHQGVIGFLSQIDYSNVHNVIPFLFEQGKTPIILILDGITDVRNFGAIARSAEVFGCDALVIPLNNSAEINEDAIKTSSGALLKLTVCREANLLDTIRYLKECGLCIISSMMNSELTIFQLDLNIPVAIIVGSEQKGIGHQLLENSDHVISIPQIGQIDSLNVSVAAGVILYECLKQRLNAK